MQFADISFPDRIAFGAQSDPEWSTTVTASFGGFEVANQNWEEVKHRYDVSFAVRNVTDYKAIKAHFMQVRGRAKSFPFKDYLDFTVSSSEGVSADAEDTSDGYQLFKRYGSGADAYDRKITRPISGTLTIYRTRSAVTTTVTGSATVDYDTGTFSVSGDQEGDVYTWAGQFNVPCRYEVDRLPSLIINKEPAADGELLVECSSIQIVEVKE